MMKDTLIILCILLCSLGLVLGTTKAHSKEPTNVRTIEPESNDTSSSSEKMFIYNTNGVLVKVQVLYSVKIKDKEILLDYGKIDLPKGVYIIRIHFECGVFTTKILI